MSNFEIVIGLEVHVQLKTRSKIFCSCSTDFGSSPNSNICPVCCGYPGVLPVFNRKVLELSIRVCHALDCRINKKIYFERKNYFYPDLPKDYQISQYKMPLGENGNLELISGRKIKINRAHMEEDAGKLIHKEDYSLVDFNRTGIPLLEIVSEPDIHTPQEAFDYLTRLKLLLQYINVSDCDMEKGYLRCDANISLRKSGESVLGTKVELKNMNTFKGIKSALEFEAKRQEQLLLKNERIVQETRLWNEKIMKSEPMRSKEEAHDYRYFPEPDLLDFNVSNDMIENEKKFVTELPLEKRKRFLEKYKISFKEVDLLVANQRLSDFFEEAIDFYAKPKEISNWIIGPLLEQANNFVDKFNSVKISAENFAKIVKYFTEGRINNLAAKRALSLCISTNEDADTIINQEGLLQVSAGKELEDAVKQVVEEHSKPVKEYLEGKQQAIMFLVGQVMKKTKGRANPKIAKEMLTKEISKKEL